MAVESETIELKTISKFDPEGIDSAIAKYERLEMLHAKLSSLKIKVEPIGFTELNRELTQIQGAVARISAMRGFDQLNQQITQHAQKLREAKDAHAAAHGAFINTDYFATSPTIPVAERRQGAAKKALDEQLAAIGRQEGEMERLVQLRETLLKAVPPEQIAQHAQGAGKMEEKVAAKTEMTDAARKMAEAEAKLAAPAQAATAALEKQEAISRKKTAATKEAAGAVKQLSEAEKGVGQDAERAAASMAKANADAADASAAGRLYVKTNAEGEPIEEKFQVGPSDTMIRRGEQAITTHRDLAEATEQAAEAERKWRVQMAAAGTDLRQRLKFSQDYVESLRAQRAALGQAYQGSPEVKSLDTKLSRGEATVAAAQAKIQALEKATTEKMEQERMAALQRVQRIEEQQQARQAAARQRDIERQTQQELSEMQKREAAAVCATELNGCIDRVTYSLGITGLEETVEYTKERPPGSFENERELERQKERGELFPGQRAEKQEVEELSYWARILKALKQGQQAKPYLNLNDVILKPLGAIHCSPTAVYPSRKVNEGDCIFREGGKVNDRGMAFAGVVTCRTSNKMAVPVATQGVVPVRISGSVRAGDAVGCELGSRVATAASPGSRPVGVVMMNYDGKHGEVLLPVRLGAADTEREFPFEVVPVVDKKGKVKLEVVKDSHLLVGDNKKSYTQSISGLGKSFGVGKKGDKIYLRMDVKDDKVNQFAVPSGAKIMHGPVGGGSDTGGASGGSSAAGGRKRGWTHYPDPIQIKQGNSKDAWDKGSRQTHYFHLIAELADVADARPGFVVPGLGGKKVKVVQLLFTNLMATPAFTTKQAYEPFLPVLVCIPWCHPGTKDGKSVPKAKAGDLMTPWSFGLGLPIPKDIKRAYMLIWEKSQYWKVLEAPKKGQYLPIVNNSSWGWIKTKKCKGGGSDSSGSGGS